MDQNHTKVREMVLSYLRTKGPQVLHELREHPLYDEWMDFIYSSVNAYFQHSAGWIYAVLNPVNEGFIKVGMTANTPATRLRQLNNEAVIGEFVIVQSWFTHDRFYVEAKSHQALAAYPRHKEFFHGNWREICAKVSAALQEEVSLMECSGFSLPILTNSQLSQRNLSK